MKISLTQLFEDSQKSLLKWTELLCENFEESLCFGEEKMMEGKFLVIVDRTTI
jgi:hypothetical protein